LENGFIGEFSKEKINKTISYLTYYINEKEIKEIEEVLKSFSDREEPEYLKLKKSALISENKHITTTLNIDLSIERKQEHKNLIKIIGEDVIKLKLNEMVDLAFQNKEND